MPATFISIGDSAHDSERQAIRYLVDGLPSSYTVYGNPWLVQRSGVLHELDAVVVAPHAVFVVEIKGYRGRIEGTDHDWYTPYPMRSPLGKNRRTAQILKDLLRAGSFQAGQVWVEGLLFLSGTTDLAVTGPASRERIHSRKTVLSALQDEALVKRLSNLGTLPRTTPAEPELVQLFTGLQRGPRPVRRVREYEIVETLAHHDTFTELLGRNSLSGDERVLRTYCIPPLATDQERARVVERARWEAQVLGRLATLVREGRCTGILSTDPPFEDEAGIVLPFEHFKGISLGTWLDKYGTGGAGKLKADLRARTDLWMRIARTLDAAHQEGVVHRLLRPEVILVEDRAEPEQIRVTGFDLAKQISSGTTIHVTTLADERLAFAAPEVVHAFSSAEPASDQFSLGAILALLLTGKPLFEHTRDVIAARRITRRVSDMNGAIPLQLDEAVARMVSLRPTERYSKLADAIDAVLTGRNPQARAPVRSVPATGPALDPDNLPEHTRVGTDYEIVRQLGRGGTGVVYAARHLVSGAVRALKVARPDPAIVELLLGEEQILKKLDHENIVRLAGELTRAIEGRLTMVMERAGTSTLRAWLADHPALERGAQRRLAEDLLAALDHLEQKGIVHKDLKPDNLLVNDGRLVVIDFSLAPLPADAVYGGTALYRDPSSARWSHGSDRFAAAMCLFEIYAGRHAFDNHVPEPGEEPAVREDDIDPPGLAAFFRKALDVVPEKRYPSAKAMRDALLFALGEEVPGATSVPPPPDIDASTSLHLTGLPRRAVNALARNQIRTVGELLALPAVQVRALGTTGHKTENDILAFQETVRARGIAATSARPGPVEPPLVVELRDCPEPVHKLALPAATRSALQARHPTIGAVASLTHAELLKISGIGRASATRVVEALHQFRAHSPGEPDRAHTLDRFWELASLPLTDLQRTSIERAVGLGEEPEVQGEIAADLGKSHAQISTEISKGLERLDLSQLADPARVLDELLDGFGGIVRLDELGRRFEEVWPSGIVTGEGLVRLLVRVSSGRAHVVTVDGSDAPLVGRPVFDRETLRAYTAEVERVAGQWPPVEPESARRTLRALLPHFDGDPVDLAPRTCQNVEVARTGHLYIPPLDPKQTIGFVLARVRKKMSLDALATEVCSIFGPDTAFPDPDRLPEVLGDLDYRIQGEEIVPGERDSILAAPAPRGDSTPIFVGASRSPEVELRDKLLEASATRGFRMLVTPAEKHAEIGRSVATAIGGTWLSFEDAFFTEHAADMTALQRAERFVAQHGALTDAAEQTLFGLLDRYGQPGRTLVLGDTALFGLCEALDLPRRLYDDTMSGSRGFWVLVVPGYQTEKQPFFNDHTPLWHLEGATLALTSPLPARDDPE